MKNAIRAIIVDDEIHARENLKFLIEEHCPEISVVGLADGVESAEDLFHRLKPNVVFLDIRMPSGAEGFDLLEKLGGEKFKVIFVTAFKDYAIRAFERRALHYILKPIDEMDLRETVARLTENLAEADHDDDLDNLKEEINENVEPVRLTIHHSKGIRIVEIGTITYLESSGNCTVLHFRDGSEYLDTRTLKIYEAILPSYFHRVHRSYIVNLRETAEILHGNDQSVVLKTGHQVPVARERKRELLEAINSIS